jgi:hypothetical protein
MTLVELLIVILIMLMITAIVIPATAPALTGRRQREAARMVDVFVNGARSRALQTGRPYGVMFERFPNSPNMSLAMSYVEVPPAYTGDFAQSATMPQGSTILLLGNGAFGAWQGPPSPGPWAPWLLPATPAGSGNGAGQWVATGGGYNNDHVFLFGDSSWIGTVSPGDILVIKGVQYRIYAGEPFIDTADPGASGYPYNGVYDQGEPFADCDMNRAYTGPTPGSVDPVTGFFTMPPTPGTATWTYMYADLAVASQYMNPNGVNMVAGTPYPIMLGSYSAPGVYGKPANPHPSVDYSFTSYPPPPPLPPNPILQPQYPFQITRRPIKSAGTEQQLPDGTAIDLGALDQTGNKNPYNVVPGSGLDLLPNFFGTFMPNGATDSTPVIVTFAPNGAVDKVFSWDPRGIFAGTSVVGNVPVGWQGRSPTSPIYFLVTRRELIGGDLTAPAPQAVSNSQVTYAGNPLVNPQYGIQDLTSLWIAINPSTGLVTTAANAPIRPLGPASNLPAWGTQSYQAREFARQAQLTGGR